MNSRGSDYLSLCQFLSATISKTVRSDVNFLPLHSLLALEHIKYRINFFFFPSEQLSPGGECARKTPHNQKSRLEGAFLCEGALSLEPSKALYSMNPKVPICLAVYCSALPRLTLRSRKQAGQCLEGPGVNGHG